MTPRPASSFDRLRMNGLLTLPLIRRYVRLLWSCGPWNRDRLVALPRPLSAGPLRALPLTHGISCRRDARLLPSWDSLGRARISKRVMRNTWQRWTNRVVEMPPQLTDSRQAAVEGEEEGLGTCATARRFRNSRPRRGRASVASCDAGTRHCRGRGAYQ